MADELLDHETAFVRAFIRSERQKTFLRQLANPKWRRPFLDRLNHRFLKDLDPAYVTQACNYTSRVLAHPELSCHIIADEAEYDGRTVTVNEAFDLLHRAYFGIIISFIPGRLAYYRDEENVVMEKVWLVRDE
jgi:hypothetical protein